MVKQYPYTLEIEAVTGGGRDVNGDYLPTVTEWVLYSKCRDENGTGKQVTLDDGTGYQYQFLVQMPRGVERIPVGTEIRVMDGVEVRERGKIVYSRKDQLHTRAWV